MIGASSCTATTEHGLHSVRLTRKQHKWHAGSLDSFNTAVRNCASIAFNRLGMHLNFNHGLFLENMNPLINAFIPQWKRVLFFQLCKLDVVFMHIYRW